ncbi:MAG: gliding motility-associated C-terminal domain-containing protein [Bacteroidota bacterium]
MKKIILLFTIFLTSLSSFSQDGVYSMGRYGTCPASLTACSVRLLSDNSQFVGGDGVYWYSEDDQVVLRSSTGSLLNVNLTFHYMQNAADYVYVYDGPSTASPLIASWTGNSLPPTCDYGLNATTTGSVVTIRYYTSAGTETYFTSSGSKFSGFDLIVGCVATTCFGNPPAGDNCASAAQICNLNNYCGNTSGWYNADNESLLQFATGAGFAGSIENNSWISFVAATASATLNVTSSSCLNSSIGIQGIVYQSTNCSTFTPVSGSYFSQGGAGFGGAQGLESISLTGLIPGNNYYLMIDGYAGNICSYSVTATGVQVLALTASSASICPGQSVTVTAPTGATGYTFSPTPSSVSGNVATYLAIAANTTVSAIVGGYCGATSTVTVPITVKPTPTLTAISSQTVCAGSTVSAVIFTNTPTGGTFSWANSNTSIGLAASGTGSISSYAAPSVSSSTTGVITVTPTLSGCVGTARNFSITINPKPTSTVTASPTSICLGSSVSFTAGTASTYTWSGSSGNGLAGTSGANVSATPTSSGSINYTVNMTSAATGCTNTTVQTITVNPPITISVSSATTCSGITSTIIPSGATTYTLINTGGSGTSFTVSPTSTTTYSIIGATATCTSNITTATLTVNSPTLTPAFTNTTFCQGNTSTLSVTGSPASPYVSFGVSPSAPISSTLAPTNSTINVSGLSGTVGTSLLNVIVNLNHTYDSDLTLALICPDGTIITLSAGNGGSGDNYTNTTFTASGGTAIASGAAPFTGTFAPQQAFSGLSTCALNGAWKLRVTDNVGGDNGTLLNWSLTFANQNTYSWAPTTNLSPTTGTNVVASPTTTTVYTVTATDAKGCSIAKTVTVTVNPIPTLTITTAPTNSICSGGVLSYTFSGANTYSIGGVSSTASNTFIPAPVGTNVYTINATAANGCTNTAVKTISVIANPIADAGTGGTLTCTSTTLSLSGSGGATYNWTGPASGIVSGNTSATPVVSVQGTYSLAVTSTAGCTSTLSTVAVTQDIIAPTVTATPSGSLNCTTTTVNIVASTTTTPASYTWTGAGITAGASTQTVSVNQQGTFNYTVTNTLNGCKTTGSQLINQDITAPTLTVSPQQTLTCGGGAVTLTGTAIPSTCTPVWSGGVTSGATSYTASASASNVYTLTVTNPYNNCVVSKTVNVNPSPGLPALSTPAISNSITCALSSSSVVVTTTTSPVTYSWSGTGITSGVTSNSIAVNASGNYTLFVQNTSAPTCTTSLIVFVPLNNTPPSPSATSTLVLTCAPGNSVSPLNGMPASGVTYTWSGPSVTSGVNSQNAVAGAPGQYTLNVTSTVNGCTNTAVTTVSQNITPPSPSATSTLVLTCAPSNSVSPLNGMPTSGVTYTWSGPSVTSGTNSQNAVASAPGTYTLKVTDAINSCTAAAVTTVTQNITPPSPTATSTLVLTCAPSNSVSPLNGMPASGVTYTWSGPSIIGGTNSQNATADAPGTYTLKVTDAINSCTAAVTTTVTQNITPPTPSAVGSGSLTCINTVMTLTASPASGVTYQWTGPGLTGSSTNATAQATVSGVYTIQVTSNTNSCTASNTVNVLSDYSSPSATANHTGTLTCTTPTLLVSGGPLSGVTYTWTGPGITTSVNNATIIVNQPGSYDVVITNTVNGCQNSARTDVVRDIATPTVTISNPAVITCTSTTIDLSASPVSGVTYTWSGAGITSGGSTATPSVNVGGIYTLSVTNTTNGCIGVNTTTVSSNLIIITPTIALPAVLNCTNTSQALAGSPATGVTYTWTGTGITAGGNSSSPTVNQPGIYTLSVTNTTNGCVGSKTVSVTQNNAVPSVSVAPTASLNCTNTITTIALSTTASPVSYTWTGPGIQAGNGTGNVTINEGGTYSYTVTNTANSCTTTGSQSVIQNTNTPSVGASTTGSLNCTTTTVNIGITTLASPVSYTWTGTGIISASNINTITVNQGGSFSYTVTNTENTCKTTGSEVILQNTIVPTFTLGTAPTLSTTCANPNATLTASSNADPNTVYTWITPSSSTVTGNPLYTSSTGIYTVAVTNTLNGCSSASVLQHTVEVIADSGVPTVTLTPSSATLTCNNPTVSITVGTNATSPSFSWTPIAGIVTGTENSATPSFTAPGTYSFVIKNNSTGCATSYNNADVVVISSNTTAPTFNLSSGSNTGTLTCSTLSVITTPTITSSANGTLSYTWTSTTGSGIVTSPNQASATFTATGVYTLSVLNTLSGCMSNTNAASTFTVYQNTTIPTMTLTTAAANNGTITCNNPSVVITPTIVPSNATYTWTSATGVIANTSSVSITSPNTYTLMVTDAVTGCVSSNTNTASTFTVYQNTTIPTMTLTTAAVNDGTITCNNPSVLITPTIVPGNATYTWTSDAGVIANTSSISITSPNTYTLVVTDVVTGCVSSNTNAANTFTVYENTTIPTMTLTTASANNGTLTCSTTSIVITPTINPSSATYTWTSGAGVVATTQSITITSPDIYTLTVTDAITGCVSSSTNTANTFTVIANNTPPTFTLGTAPSVTATCAVPSVTLSATSNADPNSVYTWVATSTASVTGTPFVTSTAGIYTVFVTNTTNSCSSTSVSQNTVEVIADSGIPVVTLSSNTESITCLNPTPTITLTTAATPVSYSWTPTSGIVAGTENSATPSFSLDGIYSVIVENTNTGCATGSTANTVTITLNNSLPTMTLTTAAMNSGTLNCLNTVIVVTPTIIPGNATYTWTSGAGVVANTSSISITSPDVYTLTVTDAVTGCVNTSTNSASTFTVTEDIIVPSFTLGTASSVTTTCSSPNAILSVSSNMDPNAIYTWTTPSSSTLTGSPISVSAPGIYSVVVTNTINGCSTSSATSQNTVEVVTGTGIPSVSLTLNTLTITCSSPTVNTTASTTSSPVSYSWSPATGIVPGTETTANPSFTAVGSYSVIVTNTVSGCQSSITSNVVDVMPDNTLPIITLSSATNSGTITCPDPTVTITATPSPANNNLTYSWLPAGASVNQSTSTFTTAGVYTLVVTNTLTGCVTTSTNTPNIFTVFGGTTSPSANIMPVSTNSTIGCSGTSSFVTLSAQTATSNITTWLPDGLTQPTFTVTSNGTYSLVTVDPLTLCRDTQTITITGNTITPQGVDAGTSVNIACGNSTVALTGVSTSTNVNYSWSGPSATSILSGSNTPGTIVGETGSYTLTVTDNSTGCQSTAFVVVSQANVTAAFTADPTTGISPLTVNFTDASVGATNWAWSFGDSNSSVVQNPSNIFTTGSYTVTLTASSGSCTGTSTLVIIVEDPFTLEIPNVFTPNGDGANDVFTIKSTGIKEISMQIFNRWGEKLYEFAGPKASWDGLAPNGLQVPTGTYFYFVKATGFDDSEVEKNGTMNLFR